MLKQTYHDIIKTLPHRANVIQDTSKIAINNCAYRHYIASIRQVEFLPDIILFDYEQSLNTNRYLQHNYPTIANKVWMVGDSGQGDGWFIHQKTNHILFFDHDIGDYQSLDDFYDMNISFELFIVLADLYRQLDVYVHLFEHELSNYQKQAFVELINSIEPNLFSRYPYTYF